MKLKEPKHISYFILKDEPEPAFYTAKISYDGNFFIGIARSEKKALAFMFESLARALKEKTQAS